MSDEFCELNGEVLSSDNLSISKARDFASAVINSDYAWLVECKRTTSDSEIIVFDAKVQVGQKTVYDIKRYERLAVVFESSDAVMPKVLALRKDFPRVPHINLCSEEFPRSLCITEQQYSEWRLQYTGASLLENIRQWLTLTAKDTLHADDQPLEPLFVGSRGELILPSDYITNTAESELLAVTIVETRNLRPVFIAERPEDVYDNRSSLKYVATSFKSTPQPHGIVNSTPADLFELHDYLTKGNINLIPKLRSRLIEWKDKYKEIDILDTQLILVISLPKTRNGNLVPEETELCAFLTGDTLRKIGIEIGLWAYRDQYPPYLGLDLRYLVPIDWSKKGNNIQIVMLNTHSHFSRELGTHLNGLSPKVSSKFTAIGLGALGSQVFMNMIRAGQGEWTLIDKDILLPHNLARHALDGFSVGHPKVDTLAVIANKIVDGNPIANSIVADILNPVEVRETLKTIKEAFNTADIILDVSASIAVARYLVHDVDSPTRRISLFLNPVGTDVTVLAEDSERKTTLDSLEMQYYRHIINEDCLEGLLQMEPEHFRYSNSCSDVSATIPQDFVAMHAAICSRTIYQLTSNKQPLLSIWRIDADQFSVQKYSFPVKKTIKYKKGEWKLFTDEGFINQIHEERRKKLPNETGGVLIGSYDMQRKIVYVVDYLPSPPDSKEWPTHYIRGCQGLRSKIEKIQQSTTNRIKYVGEWHSHPPNCNVNPSQDDRKVFAWISEYMTVDGLPPLMLIVGDPGKYAFYLEDIS